MVAKVCDQGVCPVRVFNPLNVGGAFGFRSIGVNILLRFCTTLPYTGHDVREEGGFSHALGMAASN